MSCSRQGHFQERVEFSRTGWTGRVYGNGGKVGAHSTAKPHQGEAEGLEQRGPWRRHQKASVNQTLAFWND